MQSIVFIRDKDDGDSFSKRTSNTTISDEIEWRCSTIAAQRRSHRAFWLLSLGNWGGKCHGNTRNKKESDVHDESRRAFWERKLRRETIWKFSSLKMNEDELRTRSRGDSMLFCNIPSHPFARFSFRRHLDHGGPFSCFRNSKAESNPNEWAGKQIRSRSVH